MAKATTTIRQTLNYRSDVQAYFAANQALFDRVASFYFDVIQAHPARSWISPTRKRSPLLRSSLIPLKSIPNPVIPRTEVQADIPAMFRRAAINAALGSARSFSGQIWHVG